MNKRLMLESLRDIETAILMELQSIAIPFSNNRKNHYTVNFQ